MGRKEKNNVTVCNSWKFSDKEVSGTVEEIDCLEENTSRRKRNTRKGEEAVSQDE